MRRGLVVPSPVVLLSIVAVMMAGVAFVVTRNAPPAEKEITTISEQPTASPDTGRAADQEAADQA